MENHWNRMLKNACLRGHINMIDLSIKKGANNFDEGLTHACIGGHIDVP